MLNVSKTVAKWAKIKESERAGESKVAVKASGGKRSEPAKADSKPSNKKPRRGGKG